MGSMRFEAREATDILRNKAVVGSRKTERGQIKASLSFGSVRKADEAVIAISEIQHSVGIEGVDSIERRLLGDETKSVANVICARVVVVRAVAIVPAIPLK